MALSQSVASELLEAFRAGEGVDLIRESVRLVMQELIETDASQRIGADRYERTESRVTDRNGSRPRLVSTQAGDVQLRIPKLRKGSFFPVILEPRRRIDQALYAVVMEAYVQASRLARSTTWSPRSVSTPASPSRRYRGFAPAWTSPSTRFGLGRCTTPSSRTCSSTPPTCTSAATARSPRWPLWSRPASPPAAAEKSSASTSAIQRMRCFGAVSSAP